MLMNKIRDHSILSIAIQAMKKYEYRLAEELLMSIKSTSYFFYAAQINLAMLHLRHNPRGIEMAEEILIAVTAVADELYRTDFNTYLVYQRVRFEVFAKQNRMHEASQVVEQCDDDVRKVFMTSKMKSDYANFNNSIAVPMITIDPEYALVLLDEAMEYVNPDTDVRIYAGIFNNRGNVYLSMEEYQAAYKAFSYSWEYATKNEIENEIHRANVGIANTKQGKTTSSDVDIIVEAAEYSKSIGDCEGAVVRACVALQLSKREQIYDRIEKLVHYIIELSVDLDVYSLNRNRALYFAGSVLLGFSNESAAAVKALSQAVQGFFATSNRADHSNDKTYIMVEGHFCFRELANHLIEKARIDEACMLMELARFYGWAFTFSAELTRMIIEKDPLKALPYSLDISLLNSLMLKIRANEVHVHLAIIPPNIVAFVIRSDEIKHVKMRFTEAFVYSQDGGLYAIPQKLEDGFGMGAIPKIIIDFADKISEVLNQSILTKLVPYAGLHLVPWREMLQAADENLDFTEFSICFSGLEVNEKAYPLIEKTAILSYFGKDESFNQETKEFKKMLGAGILNVEADSDQVTAALEKNEIVYLSCHAKLSDDGSDVCFILEDGSFPGMDLVPEKLAAKLVILSSCDSATFFYTNGEVLSGTIPSLLSKGCDYVIATRFRISQLAAFKFAHYLGQFIKSGLTIEDAFSKSKKGMKNDCFGIWKDIACIELFSR
jgi:tetratricopeptide (TPR) repeat protein